MIVIACDKFKGTMTSEEVSSVVASALRDAGVRSEIRVVVMADGGEGTARAIGRMDGLKIVESSAYAGPGCFDMARTSILDRSTFALGEAVRHELDRGNKVYVGIGGTATADGGAGFLQALGVRFYDSGGSEITTPLTPRTINGSLASVGSLPEGLKEGIAGLSDVCATLTGPGLSALDFLVQKGASASDCKEVVSALDKLRRLFGDRSSRFDGAGGGLGFALAAVVGAPCMSGADFILERLDINPDEISLLITGEGSIDYQTSGGKVVDAVNRYGLRKGITVWSIGGKVEPGCSFPWVVSTMNPTDLPPSSSPEARSRLYETVRREISECSDRFDQ